MNDMDKITRLLKIGQLSVDYWLAVENVSHLKRAYCTKIQEYEEEVRVIEGRLSRWNDEHKAALDYTAAEYKALQDARRVVNNLRRRIRHASIVMHIDDSDGKFKE